VEKALKNGADIMVNLDADGQFSPEDIPKMVSPVLLKKQIWWWLRALEK